jgi:hypothetical protein
MTKYLIKRDASGEIVDKIAARKGRPPKGYKIEDIAEDIIKDVVENATKNVTENVTENISDNSIKPDAKVSTSDAEEDKVIEPPKNSRVYKSGKKITTDQLASIFCNGKRNAGSFLYCDTYSQRHYPKDLLDIPWFKPNMTLGKVEVIDDCVGVWIIDATKETPDVVIKDLISI